MSLRMVLNGRQEWWPRGTKLPRCWNANTLTCVTVLPVSKASYAPPLPPGVGAASVGNTAPAPAGSFCVSSQATASPASGRASAMPAVHAPASMAITPGTPWATVQRVDHPEPAAANAEALHDLENGATGLSLVFAGAVGAYGYGLPATDDAIARALAGVHLDAGIGIDLDLGPDNHDIAARLAALVEGRGIALRDTACPIIEFVRHGEERPSVWPEIRRADESHSPRRQQ